ncbi:hypothetical protein FOCG_05239 [Fusarium oxysporum f. sp. radicis-lycopersici 26381]|nr:hypothetical protein FOCG_05239 [Fusarium oxysporum f. sp. radicis-lycopersici 26381]
MKHCSLNFDSVLVSTPLPPYYSMLAEGHRRYPLIILASLALLLVLRSLWA